MKRIKLFSSIAALFILLTALSTIAQEHEGHKMEMKESGSNNEEAIDLLAVDKNEDGKVFECPMDWEVLSDEQGRCSKCDMKLKEYTILDAKTNLEEHGHKVGTHKSHMNDGQSEHKMAEKNIDVEDIDKNEDGKVFQCPMCADQLSDKAAKCPTCDMDLKELSIDDAKGKLHEHEGSEKSNDEHKMKTSASKKCEYGCCS